MKKLLLTCLTVGTFLWVLIYFLSCLTPYITPRFFWPMSFLALGFPYLAAGIIGLIFIWLFIKKKISLFLVVILLAGYQNLFSTVGIHFLKHPIARPAGALRILTWNVRGFDNPSTYIDTLGSIRQQMFDFIRETNPDIICTQEFTEHFGKGMVSNTTELLDLGYNYYYRTNEMSHLYPYGLVVSGSAIFSRLPITDSGKVMYNDSSYPEHLAYVDIQMQGKPLRIFSTHFKSFNFGSIYIENDNRAKYYGDTNFIYDASKFEKLKVFSQDQVLQSRLAKSILNKSPYPVIFCGDLNSVPTSYQYHTIADGLQDAFLQKGCGLGTTMDSLPKTLRIDYMLVDKKISIKNYFLKQLHLSDHYPQIIDVTWKDN